MHFASAAAVVLLLPWGAVAIGQGSAGSMEVEAAFNDLSRRVAAGPPPESDETFEVAVDLSGDNLEVGKDEASGRWRILYRMNFNQVAEGWSWQPQANPAERDFYRFKYLPLGTVDVQDGGVYVAEDLPGRTREFRKVRRYAYYLAFENPYEFFSRPQVEDDAGFSLELPEGLASGLRDQPSRLRMLATATRQGPYRAESTTYWRATDGNPTELTLKNRYLIGTLREVRFVDPDGRLLGRIAARPGNGR